jgi:hypothetical protein
MAAGVLPEDGELQLGPVRLPAGRRFTPYEHDEAVAWLTRRKVPDPGLIWSALSDLHGETGLVPVVLNDDEDDDEDLFMEPCDVAEIDELDPAELLATHWEGELDDDDEEVEVFGPWTPRSLGFPGLTGPGEGSKSLFDFVGAVLGVAREPGADADAERFSELDRQEAELAYKERAARSNEGDARRAGIAFPGLAPVTGGNLSSAARTAALRSLRPARIGLVAARRPADVLATVGWTCFDDPAYEDGIPNAVWIGAVLRSWEDRFGARLVAIGPRAEIRLLAQRPPRTLEAAAKIAQEHSAFCTECAGQGLRTVREIAPVLGACSSPIDKMLPMRRRLRWA